METRHLGKSKLEVTTLGLGCLAIGGPFIYLGAPIHFGEVDDAESLRALHRALDLGINFFDTAANYGAGRSERLLGQAVADRREHVVIATKFGYLIDEERKTVDYYGGDINSEEVVGNIRSDCEASLRRLNTDYIDLYQFHISEYSPMKAVAVRDMLEELVAEGKIRYYGWSTGNPEGARVFAQGEHCVAIQHMLNVVFDAPEMLAVCAEFQQASIARGPLASGFLTGKYNIENIDSLLRENDFRSIDLFRERISNPILERLNDVRDILSSDGRTLAQGALAWIWTRSEHTIPIPGFRMISQVEENFSALKFGQFNAEQMLLIDEILGHNRGLLE